MDGSISRHGAFPAAPYSARPPSPPTIVIPSPNLQNANEQLKVVPSYEMVDPASLSVDDLKIITQNFKEQLAQDSAANWTYESRRVAQPILDFLYLGPSSVARDQKWLRNTGITMLLAARDSQMANIRLMAVDRVAQELGIQAEYIDVSGYNELIRAFPSAVRTINNHMLNVFRGQRISNADVQVEGGKMVIPSEQFRRGKVLVFCETGNDRSAGVVVAYLMSVFGMSMIEACQFVHFKRFCVGMADDLRFVLKSYGEILSAQRTVHRHELDNIAHHDAIELVKTKKQKRGIEDTMDKDEDMEGTDAAPSLDQDRFLGRRTFVPFVDIKDNFPGHEGG
ncbi:phosphatases II [Jackrogersella minutella]|nr:phosphatases II [Jackrogersella minutella]